MYNNTGKSYPSCFGVCKKTKTNHEKKMRKFDEGELFGRYLIKKIELDN